MQYPLGGAELYDMQNDPHQFTNLAGKREHADTVSGLKQQLAEKLASMKE